MMSVILKINLRARQVRRLEIRMRSLFFIAKYHGLTLTKLLVEVVHGSKIYRPPGVKRETFAANWA
jgi:hypothetical protein